MEKQKLDEYINVLENEYDVKVIGLINAGSQAWKLNALDSDYDVLGIFVRSFDDEFGIVKMEDTISIKNDDLNMEGKLYSLKKFISAIARCDLHVFESCMIFRNEAQQYCYINEEFDINEYEGIKCHECIEGNKTEKTKTTLYEILSKLQMFYVDIDRLIRAYNGQAHSHHCKHIKCNEFDIDPKKQLVVSRSYEMVERLRKMKDENNLDILSLNYNVRDKDCFVNEIAFKVSNDALKLKLENAVAKQEYVNINGKKNEHKFKRKGLERNYDFDKLIEDTHDNIYNDYRQKGKERVDRLKDIQSRKGYYERITRDWIALQHQIKQTRQKHDEASVKRLKELEKIEENDKDKLREAEKYFRDCKNMCHMDVTEGMHYHRANQVFLNLMKYCDVKYF